MNSISKALQARILTWFATVALGLGVWQIAEGQVTNIFTINHPQATLLGLVGTYFNNIYLTNAVFSRNDATINFNWGTGSPDPRLDPTHYSVRWTGKVVPVFTGTYTFYATTDDGMRVWIDGQLLIDAWIDTGATRYTNSVNLTGGVRHDLQVEYYNQASGPFNDVAFAELTWSGPDFAEKVLGSPPQLDGTADGFGTTLASTGGGQFAVGAPSFDVFVNTFFPVLRDGRAWYGDTSGVVGGYGNSPWGFDVGVERGFGNSLSLRGDGALLIGCSQYRGGCGFGCFLTNEGAVFIGDSGQLQSSTTPYVLNPSGLAQTFFGSIVVGLTSNHWAASSTEGHGKVYLFADTTVTGVITNPNAAPAFPWTMCAFGTNRLLVSSVNDVEAGDHGGSVFIYDLAGNLLKIVHNTGGAGEGFGKALAAVDEHRFLVGAPDKVLTYVSGGQQGTNFTAGVVYLYDDTGQRLVTFTAPDVSVCSAFGSAISILGSGRVLIGSPLDQVNSVAVAGQVYLYNLGGLHLETVSKPNPASGDNFGSALCGLDERHFVVGAPGDSTLAAQAGSIYGFDAPLPSADLGAEIPPPDPNVLPLNRTGTFPITGPAVSPLGAAFWNAASGKLFAVKPGAILVSWPLDPTAKKGDVYNWQASISWPTNTARFQVHVAGQTPVDLSSGGTYSNVVLEATTTDANAATVASTRVFSAQNPGLSLLMLSSGDPTSNAIRFQLVRSIPWNDPTSLFDNALATVGQPIADPAGFHDPAAGSPQVVLPSAVYCPAPVFDPATRSGTIIPVNQDIPGTPANDLVVAFYQRGMLLYDPVTSSPVSNNIYWPYKPVRFQPQWPTNAPHLIIASQQGTGVIDPTQFVNWQLYYQNDPTQPGFNPNDEHALRLPYNGGEAVFALRSDLGTPKTSQPFVLMRYQDPASGGQWRMKLWQVVAQESPWFFNYPATAGVLLQPPFPLSAMAPSPQTAGVSGPYWEDRKLFFWAKAAGDDGGPTNIVMHYFYAMQSSFFYPGTNPPPVGTSIPLLDLQAGTPGTPIDVRFNTTWPASVPQLRVGETLVKPKFGLPDISAQTSVQIVYDQSVAQKQGPCAELIDPTHEYHVPLAQLPSDVQTTSQNGFQYFPTLPPQLHDRFYYDPTGLLLRFKGQFIAPPAGEYYLLLNVLTARETSILLGLSADPSFQSAVNALSQMASSVTQVLPNATGFDSEALTAGQAQGQGYVTLAFGNNPNLSPPAEPISLAVIRVTCPTYQGQIEVIPSANPFDEKLTLRHSGDFAGQSDSNIFEWRTLPPVNGLPSTAPPDQWTLFTRTPASGQGAVDVTIQGPGLFTLSDNYFIARYRPVSSPLCASPTNTLGWSDWTAPMLAEGWVKRVLAGINPFEQRVQSYQNSQVNTIVSMISQAGKPYQGPIALNQQNANQFGLIETYETVLQRGMSLSVNGAPPVNYGPANNALLLAAGRLSDLYMVLANEAYADAEDPTIAFGTDDKNYGAEATSLHCFQNQTASLMEEELDLLRGRDNSKLPSVQTPPVYNRLIWNFTQGIDGGEVAYALNYNIRAQDGSVSGTISAADAAALYPQGHGDAWGHYLSAVKNYYRLLRNPNFTWVPQIEAVLVGGVPVSVGYEHERKFASAAAARAQAGAEIVNLTYRSAYVEDPAGQWQGYTDPNTNRAWGLAEWGSRAGEGAFFDWVTANALLPAVDSDPTHTGIQKIDRTTVTEIGTIASAFNDIQSKVDQADKGLNPLGLAKNVVPFDIDPTLIAQNQTHFEQIYNRALIALNNAITVFNRANNCSQLLRQQSDTVANFQKTVTDQEVNFNSRLVEIFGYPYGDDIGPTGSYPTGYNGPDIYHYDYVDSSQIVGTTPPPTQTFTVNLVDTTIATNGALMSATNPVSFTIASDNLGFVKPTFWTQPRRAPGQIQLARSDLLQTYARFQKALGDYNNLIAQIDDKSALIQQQFNVNTSEINLMNQNLNTQQALNQVILFSKAVAIMCQEIVRFTEDTADATAEALPKEVGVDDDVDAPIRGGIKAQASLAAKTLSATADVAGGAEMVAQQDKEISSLQTQIQLTTIKDAQAFASSLKELEVLIRQQASSRLELFTVQEALQQATGKYQAALAAGDRLLEDRLRFRQDTAAQVQQYRYKDMAFRLFRNDALQKYRAQFDLAAMYVYLAARAYDYETNLKKGDPRGPGSDFMTSIIRAQSLGLIPNGLPQIASGSGDAGLADPIARMNLDWTLVIKGQLGFNNPQTETGRFSLRSELFRIQLGTAGSKVWRDTLTRNVVPNLLTIPEVNRYCILPQPTLPVEPAIVIPFSTSINFGQNFFGWPLGGGDNAFDSTHFATKIRSVGVWFANYNNVALANTPFVYMIPVGEDVMRSPGGSAGDIRQWKILDQELPVPFQLSAGSLNDPTFIPMNDSLGGQLITIRQYQEFPAYTDSGTFDPTQVISNYRLIGRSVWNTRWLLIIPAGGLLSDRNEAIQRFINGALLPNGTRDGNGVSDIKIFFQTYAYAGN